VLNDKKPKLGGSYLSLITVNLGGAFLWLGIFIQPWRALLSGSAYALWAISMISIIGGMWKKLQDFK